MSSAAGWQKTKQNNNKKKSLTLKGVSSPSFSVSGSSLRGFLPLLSSSNTRSPGDRALTVWGPPRLLTGLKQTLEDGSRGEEVCERDGEGEGAAPQVSGVRNFECLVG